MSIWNTKERYGSISQSFHWLIFLLVVFMLVLGYLLVWDVIPKSEQPPIINLHKLLGLLTLFLMIFRGVWALINPKPNLPIGSTKLEYLAAWGMHGLLYVVIIGMCLAGWIMSVAGGKPPHLFNLIFNLPIQQNKELSKLAFAYHYWLAIVIIVLVSLHTLAAFYHHYVRKDNVLLRMTPGAGSDL